MPVERTPISVERTPISAATRRAISRNLRRGRTWPRWAVRLYYFAWALRFRWRAWWIYGVNRRRP